MILGTDVRQLPIRVGDAVVLCTRGRMTMATVLTPLNTTRYLRVSCSIGYVYARSFHAVCRVPRLASELSRISVRGTRGDVDFLGNKVYLGDWAIAASGDTALVFGTASDFSREGRAVINSVSVQTSTQLYRIPCRIEHLNAIVEI